MKGKGLLPRLFMRTVLTVLALLCGGARGQKMEAVSAAMADVGNQMAKLQKLMMGEIKKIEQPSAKCDIYTQINDVSTLKSESKSILKPTTHLLLFPQLPDNCVKESTGCEGVKYFRVDCLGLTHPKSNNPCIITCGSSRDDERVEKHNNFPCCNII